MSASLNAGLSLNSTGPTRSRTPTRTSSPEVGARRGSRPAEVVQLADLSCVFDGVPA